MRRYTVPISIAVLCLVEISLIWIYHTSTAVWPAIIGLLIPLAGLAIVFSQASEGYRQAVVNVLQPISFILAVFFVLYWIILFLKGNRIQDTGKTSDASIEKYFERIRHDDAALTAFFAAMPKGGDLHNHFTGSVYSESYLDYAINHKLWINPTSLTIMAELPEKTRVTSGWTPSARKKIFRH